MIMLAVIALENFLEWGELSWFWMRECEQSCREISGTKNTIEKVFLIGHWKTAKRQWNGCMGGSGRQV